MYLFTFSGSYNPIFMVGIHAIYPISWFIRTYDTDYKIYVANFVGISIFHQIKRPQMF